MKQKTTIIFLCVILVALVGIPVFTQPVEAQPQNDSVEYVVHYTDNTNESKVTVAVTLTRDIEYDIWSLSWSVPEDATLQSVRTASSESITTKRDGKTIELKDSDGPKRSSATFYITYNTTSQFETRTYDGITKLEGRFSALQDAPSKVTLSTTDTTIANTFRYTNHSVRTGNNTTVLTGTGPISFITNIQTQDATVETNEYLVYNSNISTTALNQSYQYSTRGLGVVPQIKQVPVIVVPDDEYDERFGTVSAGQFSSGVIHISNDTTTTNTQLIPLLTHEYTHAITERTQPSVAPTWFSEGASQYTESIARTAVDAQQPQLDEETFWDYTRNQESWVITSWPNDGDTLRFAYTYSEIMFKYTERQNEGQIQNLFKSMTINEVSVNQSTTPRVLIGSEWDGQVCNRETRQQTISCAEESLSFTPSDTAPESYAKPFEYDAETPSPTIEPLKQTPEPTPDETTSKNTPDSEPTTTEPESEEKSPSVESDTAKSPSLIDRIIEIVLFIIKTIIDIVKLFVY